jgi:hypothetical protein
MAVVEGKQNALEKGVDLVIDKQSDNETPVSETHQNN